VSKDVSIRGYFTKPKGVREQKGLGNTVLERGSLNPYFSVPFEDATTVNVSTFSCKEGKFSGVQ
jgi:hypothetical protein